MKVDIALFGLTALGAFGIWSACNSSGFTVAEFVKDADSAAKCRMAMKVGLGMCCVLGVVIYIIFKDLSSALAPVVAGAGLYAWFEIILRQKGL